MVSYLFNEKISLELMEINVKSMEINYSFIFVRLN